MYVKNAVRSWHQFDGADAHLELFENPRRQTDSVWPRASGNAVFDANERTIGHHRNTNQWVSRLTQPWFCQRNRVTVVPLLRELVVTVSTFGRPSKRSVTE